MIRTAYAATALLSLATAHGSDASRDGACSLRIIVGLKQAISPVPDVAFISDLAARNAVRLRFLRTITPDLYVLQMSASGSDPNCGAALERLRHDTRLRSVQIDARRSIRGARTS